MEDEKGFTVVELITSFALTLIISFFLFQILIEVKDIFIETTVKASISKKLGIVSKNIKLNIPQSGEVNCDLSSKSCSADGKVIIRIKKLLITVAGQDYNLPNDVEIDESTISLSSGCNGNDCKLKIKFELKNPNLSENYLFKVVYYYLKEPEIDENAFCFIGRKEILTSNSIGLYKNIFYKSPNDLECVFKGASPSNYIKLGDDMYRIIGVKNNGDIKVINSVTNNQSSNTKIIRLPYDMGYKKYDTWANIFSFLRKDKTTYDGTTTDGYDESGSNRWSSNNNNYCYWSKSVGAGTNHYNGCKWWGSSLSTLDFNEINVTQISNGSDVKNLPLYDSFINVYLNGGKYLAYSTSNETYYAGNERTFNGWYKTNVDSNIQEKIKNHLWEIGTVGIVGDDSLNSIINQSKQYLWRGKIGLLSISEYLNANDKTSCLSLGSDWSECKNSNWLNDYNPNGASGNNMYTLSPVSSNNPGLVWVIDQSNGIVQSDAINQMNYSRPVFYIDGSDINMSSGDGSFSNPYILSVN